MTETAKDRPPPIAEKVRFWEEQQRINSLLVPRVAEITQTLSAISESMSRLSAAAREADARVAREGRTLRETVSGLNTRMQEDVARLTEALRSVESRLRNATVAASADAERLSVELAELRRVRLGGAGRVAWTALVIAMLGLAAGVVAHLR